MSFLSSSTKTGRLVLLARLALAVLIPAHGASAIAESKTDNPASLQTAIFAGGCFWGVDAVFKHVKGVASVESGYAGGNADKANYEAVGSGRTGHAEAVRVRFNPAQVSYQQLLQVFFFVAHDPTQLNRQGPDVGSQYRSAIFFADPEQQKMATDQIKKLTADRTFGKPVVTQIAALQQFYPAEQYHQNYLALHPTQPYIVINDLPKIEHLRRQFPDLYQ
ncbi:peptide-methionine (S)-S-oxide reductase MsrA [Dechloromonas sp.]|uniref:peptide-methionine (S)-S-oxide reductase MsrA n=1 Tax=Dechloromonas sp. TaxID=1917218 RepID=UPI00286E2874|nr:peptide-methionine (S)-S-oxide reductase MsrA [Dechloromonas sp.]